MGNHRIIIIGSGPAGYTAGIYLARAGESPLIIAGDLNPGGQLMDTTMVENYPGFKDGIMGPDLMGAMQEQAERFGSTIEYERVTSVNLLHDPMIVRTDDHEYTADAVIITSGARRRKLDIPGESDYAGHGVSYCATCDGFFFKDKQIVVIGGGDSAAEDAIFLTRFSSSVTIAFRQDHLTATTVLQERLEDNGKITLLPGVIPERINGDGKDAGSITFRRKNKTDVGEDDHIDVRAEGVFIDIGTIPETDFLKDQLLLDDNGVIMTLGDSTLTSIPGVFAAGDVADGRYKQAVVAAGDGCRAALDAQAYLSIISKRKD